MAPPLPLPRNPRPAPRNPPINPRPPAPPRISGPMGRPNLAWMLLFPSRCFRLCLCCRAACTEGLFSICWARRRFRALAVCCCCMVALMLLTVGCLFFSMFVKLVGQNRRRGDRKAEKAGERDRRKRERGDTRKGGFQIKSFHTAWTQLQGICSNLVNAHF